MTQRQPGVGRPAQPGPRSSAGSRPKTVFGSPLAAAALSFLFPGLGQAAAGKPRRGAIVAFPFLLVIITLGFMLLINKGKAIDAAANQKWLTTLLIIDLILMVWHVWAILDSYLMAGRLQPKKSASGASAQKWTATVGVGIILSGTVLIHGGFASLDLTAQHAVGCVGSANGECMLGSLAPGETVAMPSDDSGISVIDPSADPSESASATPTSGPSIDPGTFDPSQLPAVETTDESQNWAADGQLNVLLVGIDAGAGGGRSKGLRPDTMIVLHVDIKTGRAAMIGVPRNTQCVPLPKEIAAHYAHNTNGCPNYTYPNMLNWLAGDAINHPTWFPFAPDAPNRRGVLATQQAVGALTGLTMDGFAVINLDGLVTLIDDVGGIQITVPSKVADYPCGPKGSLQAKWRVCDLCGPTCSMAARTHYGYAVSDGTGAVVAKMKQDAVSGKQKITWQSGADIAFTIAAGDQHMSGEWALAYARTRIYYTDYDRMIRQQLVLKAMRTSLDPCALLPRMGDLMNHMGSAFWTDMPLTDASKWAGMAKYIGGADVKSITLSPAALGTKATYINASTWAKAKDMVAHSLDGVPASIGGSGGAGGGGGFSC
jgi:anionic cell wall polymer biosynthesis LytR-Cps2A-Psr (LCP) family protein